MNGDSEKAFEATPQRIAKAKREGDVARSAELSANLAFVAAAAAVAGILPTAGAAARTAIAASAANARPSTAAIVVAVLALVPIGSAAAAAVAATMLQAGSLRAGGVTLKLERLNPFEGIKRMASRETAAHALRSVAAFGIATSAMLPVLIGATAALLRSAAPSASAATAWHAVERIVLAAAATGLLFALAEYAAARSAWLRRLRMSFDERKREAKEQDGDPFARGRRRALHRSLVRGAVAKVKDAAFVVVNPTHVAVALEYRPPEVAVPVVLVRAAGEAALRVRDMARLHGVPIVENAPLARALHRDSQIGRPIARAHFVAVAEIVVALRRARESQT